MFRFVILIAAIASVFGSVVPENELPQGKEGRVIGGTIAPISSFPYVVSVQRDGLHQCGGVIIAESVILTAAHCVVGTSGLKVRAGSAYVNSVGVVIDVTNVLVHERYNPNTRENDIAVMRLLRPLPLGYDIMTIPLAKLDPPNGSVAVVAGWGETTPGAPPRPVTLHYTYVNIVGRFQCTSTLYDYRSLVKIDMICAAAPGRDTCFGDAGGPLVVGYTLVGITSWGYGCSNSNYPGVYVNVAYLRNWIEKAARLV